MMNNELIERINTRNQAWVSDGMKDKIMTDCKAEIERLTKALEAKPIGEPVAWMQIDTNGNPTNLFFNSVPEDDYHTYMSLYTAPPSIDALIAEIDGLERIDFDEGGCDYPCSDGDNYRFDDVRAVLNKYRSAK